MKAVRSVPLAVPPLKSYHCLEVGVAVHSGLFPNFNECYKSCLNSFSSIW